MPTRSQPFCVKPFCVKPFCVKPFCVSRSASSRSASAVLRQAVLRQAVLRQAVLRQAVLRHAVPTQGVLTQATRSPRRKGAGRDLLGHGDQKDSLIGCIFPTHTIAARALLLDEVLPTTIRNGRRHTGSTGHAHHRRAKGQYRAAGRGSTRRESRPARPFASLSPFGHRQPALPYRILLWNTIGSPRFHPIPRVR